MPSYLSSFDVSEEIEETINRQLLTVIKNAQIFPEKNPTTKLIATYMNSIVDRSVQNTNIQFVKKILSKIQCIRSVEEVGCVIGEFVRQKIPTCFSIYTSPSEVNHLTNYICFGKGSVGLQSVKYYFTKDPSKVRIFKHYKRLLETLEQQFEFEGLATFADIEHKIAHTLHTSEEGDGDRERVLKGSQLLKKYRYIPWEMIVVCSMNIDIKTFQKTDYLSTHPTWLGYINTLFKTFSIPIWKVWLAGSFIIYILPLLPPPYDDYHFQLFDKEMRGQNKKPTQERLGLYMVRTFLSHPLGEDYVRTFVSAKLKEEVTKLTTQIKDVAEQQLGTLEWLHERTREEAQEKIKNLFLSIAYPENFAHLVHPYNHVKLYENCSVQNTFLLSSIEFLHSIHLTGRRINPHEWTDSVFEVNAYYYTEGNRLILPSGILLWPFFHIGASYGWNYGGIGAVIGHEMTHAFDVDGKDYDHEGNKRTWWTKKDNETYKQRTKTIQALYSETTYFGKHLDGELTLSENIADLGGLRLALNALKTILEKEQIQGEKRKDQFRDFFTSFAVSWRTKDKREKALQSLFTDVHSPASVRVNNIVCQFEEWYECFNIKPSDSLYIPLEQRIQIF